MVFCTCAIDGVLPILFLAGGWSLNTWQSPCHKAPCLPSISIEFHNTTTNLRVIFKLGRPASEEPLGKRLPPLHSATRSARGKCSRGFRGYRPRRTAGAGGWRSRGSPLVTPWRWRCRGGPAPRGASTTSFLTLNFNNRERPCIFHKSRVKRQRRTGRGGSKRQKRGSPVHHCDAPHS
jgi:hypothetical protein